MTETEIESKKQSKVREIVVPGEILSEDPKMIPGRGAIRTKDKIHAIFIGIKEIRGKYVNVVPLRRLYMPEIGDKIIGKIKDKSAVRWFVDINGKNEASLSPSDAVDRNRNRSYGGGGRAKRPSREDNLKSMNMYKLGDIITCKIISADRVSKPVITTLGEGLGKLKDGICIQIDVPKVPRIIGKRGSMIKLLKDSTSCRLFVSKNGRIWIRGKSPAHEKLVIDALHKIENEAHTSGLTDRIQHYIKKSKIERGIE